MRVDGITRLHMDMVRLDLRMEISMKETGLMEREVDMEESCSTMVDTMKDNGKMIPTTETEFSNPPEDQPSMKVPSLTENSKETERKSTQMEIATWENSSRDKDLEKVD